MTKKVPTLVELKLAVLNHFQATQDVAPNEQFVAGIARDECYTSHNSLVYKKKQMADKLADYETAVEEVGGAKPLAIRVNLRPSWLEK